MTGPPGRYVCAQEFAVLELHCLDHATAHFEAADSALAVVHGEQSAVLEGPGGTERLEVARPLALPPERNDMPALGIEHANLESLAVRHDDVAGRIARNRRDPTEQQLFRPADFADRQAGRSGQLGVHQVFRCIGDHSHTGGVRDGRDECRRHPRLATGEENDQGEESCPTGHEPEPDRSWEPAHAIGPATAARPPPPPGSPPPRAAAAGSAFRRARATPPPARPRGPGSGRRWCGSAR